MGHTVQKKNTTGKKKAGERKRKKKQKSPEVLTLQAAHAMLVKQWYEMLDKMGK